MKSEFDHIKRLLNDAITSVQETQAHHDRTVQDLQDALRKLGRWAGDAQAEIDRAIQSMTYAAATVSPGNRTPSARSSEWVEVHGGRAQSSYEQLHRGAERLREIRIRLPHWGDEA